MTTRQQVWWEAFKLEYAQMLERAMGGQFSDKVTPMSIADDALVEFDKRWPDEKWNESAWYGAKASAKPSEP